MKIQYLSNAKYTIWIVSIIYLFFFIIGFVTYKDFGLSIDEFDLRIHGFMYLKYLFEIFYPNAIAEINAIVQTPNISDQSIHLLSEFYGPIFNVLMAFIEYFFNINDSRDYYQFRHYFNHLIFLIANFYFFLIVKERFNSIYWAILGALLLYLSPRIFAQSFYNHKDLLFLSFFTINLYYGLIFLKKSNYKNSILFSLTTALSVDTRIMGIIIPLIIIFFYYLKYLRNSKSANFLSFSLYIILTPSLIILFWPYLWESPLINFIHAFKAFSIHAWYGSNLYFGEYISPSNLPWHYIFVWIGITTPTFYLALLLIGLSNYTWRLKNRLFKINDNESLNDLWRGEKELQDLIFYICFALPIFIVILFNSNLYDGWRHLYFIYPSLLLISLNGLYIIRIKYFRKKVYTFIFIVGLFLIQVSYVMIKNHPHQNVYFNFMAGKNVEMKFELDYWGLSNKQAFEYILQNDSKNKILIGSASTNILERSKQILKKSDRNRILPSENINADYIIDNYRNWDGVPKKEYKIPMNFKIYKEIFVGKQKIISIYKRI